MNNGDNVDFYSSEVLTQNFYKWEVRGRGWNVWDFPVSLEPPFVPYSLPIGSPIRSSVDDGRHPTFLSSLTDKFKLAFSSHNTSNSQVLTEDIDEDPEPIPFDDDVEIKELKIVLSADAEISREYCEYFLLSLSSLTSPVGFEILGTSKEITLHFSCRVQDMPFLRQQIKSFFPQVIVTETDLVTENLQEGDLYTAVVDCGLSEEFMRPVKTFKQFNPDPLTTMYAALGELRDNEVGLVQVLFQSVEAPWATNIMRAVRNNDGSSFFADAQEMIDLAEKKVGKPLYSVVLRLVGKSRTQEDAWQIVRNLYRGLTPYADPLSNEFIPLENEGYGDDLHLDDVISRQTRRSGMILNNEELLGLIHLPSPSVINPKLRREGKRSHPVPAIATGHGFVIGENIHQGIKTSVSLSIEQRLRHIHIIGKTGTGKSTLLVNMVLNSIRENSGVAVIDPHGDLIDRIIERIPEERMNDVILFDPGETEYPVGFNILEAHSEIEKTVLSSDLVELFRRFSTSWGDQMTTVLSNAIIAILESKEGGTLFELKRFLLEKEFREHRLKQGVDPAIIYFWEKEYPLLRGGSQVSIITRLDAFLRSKVIRNILTQKEGLNFKDIIEGKKIFLAKLSQGIIGEENSYLLGSLICSKIHQVAMGRQAMEASKRTPFYLYIDEFQNFATPSLASTLSSSRKYSLGLILAQQSLSQIENQVLLNSVIANPMMRICFSLGDNDAQKLSPSFTHFDGGDLMNLGVGEAIVRVERNEYDCNLATFAVPQVVPETASMRREKIIALTREMYGQRVVPTEYKISPAEKPSEPIVPVEVKKTSPIRIEVEQQPVLSDKKEAIKTKPKQVFSRVLILPDDEVNRKILSQHRYLQTLIKKMAEQRGYQAAIEEPTPDENGRVDVGLERDGKKIAVEISITTSDSWESHNIEKCLKAGYEIVIACSPEKKNLEAIRKSVSEKLLPKDLEKLKFFEPQELFLFLDQQIAKSSSSEQKIKGYRVKVKYEAVSEDEKRQKREAVAQVIVNAIKRIK
ncbi:MAG: type IV secretion system DNA-binding domain-containing protein [Bacteroidota bacterium]